MASIDKNRVAGIILLVPNAGFALLRLLLLWLQFGIMDIFGDRVISMILLMILFVGGLLTCIALWRPGRFTSLGPLPKVRLLAFVWNIMNAAWVGFLIMRNEAPEILQIGEMALSVVTAGALLFFALERKKA
jgi:hypothetical protein